MLVAFVYSEDARSDAWGSCHASAPLINTVIMITIIDDNMLACRSAVQAFGTLATGLPRSPSFTSCARKSANGVMFCARASSRAAM